MPNLGPTEIILILVVILLLFGAKKLPEFARSLGKAKTEFRKGLDQNESDEEKKSSDSEANST